MDKKRRQSIFIGALLAFAVLTFLVLKSTKKAPPPEPNGRGYYYTGAMLNKTGTAYADGNGNVVPTPPGAVPPPNKTPKITAPAVNEP